MASLNNNPYKKYKGKKKSGRVTGDAAHEMAMKAVKRSGTFQGKSNQLGQGGRAAQLKAQGVPGGVIGNLARAAQAAPGMKNFHKGKHAKKRKGTVSMHGNVKRKHSAQALSGMKKFVAEEATEKKGGHKHKGVKCKHSSHKRSKKA